MRDLLYNCDNPTTIYCYFCLDERGDGAVANFEKKAEQ